MTKNFSPIHYKDSIAARLLKVVFSIYVVISISLTALHMLTEYMNTKQSVRRELEALHQIIRGGLTNAFFDADLFQVRDILEGMATSPSILGCKLEDSMGNTVEKSGKIFKSGQIVFDGGHGESAYHEDKTTGFFIYKFPIIYSYGAQAIRMGFLYIYSGNSVIFQKVKYGFFLIVINAVIKTAALWIIFMFFSRIMLGRPLGVLTAATKELSSDNLENFEVDVGTRGRNELKILEEAFNSMVRKLHDSHVKLKDYANELDRNRRQLDDIVNNSPFMICAKDMSGRYMLINREVERIFKTTRDWVLGKTDRDMLPNKLVDFLKACDQTAINGSRPVETEINIPQDDGPHTYICTKFPLYDAQNATYGVCSIATDISERIKAERILNDFNKKLKKQVDERTRDLKFAKEQAERLKQKAEMANRAKSEFLASMSHELRTPLNAILGFSQLINRDLAVPPKHREHLSIILRSGEHLLTLINDVLDMSKIEAGRITLNKNKLNLHRMLNDLKDMMSLKAKKKSLSLIFEISNDVSQHVKADETKLRQVLVNLIGNAIKFTKEGAVTVRVYTDCDTPAELHFEIADTGPGIAPEDAAVLFDPFVQTEAGRQSGEGSGLGLAISRKFVQLMGGNIHVSSEVGKGTAFVFDIDVDPVDIGNMENKHLSRNVTGIEPGQIPKKMLIVDDNADSRKLLCQVLDPFGFELREAKNGQEAVEVWRQWAPDLIWMDVRMPVMDGYETVKILRENAKKEAKQRECVIIAQTASAFEEDREAILKAGCDDFLQKPYRESNIFDLIHKHLKVQFVYAECGGDIAEKIDQRKMLTPEAFAKLPKEVLMELQQSASVADIDAAQFCIDRIRKSEEALADELAKIVSEYRFDIIEELLENEFI